MACGSVDPQSLLSPPLSSARLNNLPHVEGRRETRRDLRAWCLHWLSSYLSVLGWVYPQEAGGMGVSCDLS